jgi:hypothetical protein
MAMGLFLVEASGEIIPCLCARLRAVNVGIIGGDGGVGESLWFREGETESGREFCGNCGSESPESRLSVGRPASDFHLK